MDVAAEPYHRTLQRTRELLLSNDRASRVHRETWRCNNATYLAYRSFLSQNRTPGAGAGSDNADPAVRTHAAASYTPPKYSFDGVSFVCDESRSAVSALSFAKVRSDLLAFANQDGDIWLLQLPVKDGAAEQGGHAGADAASLDSAAPSSSEPVVKKLPHVHAKMVTAMDWSFDNSQLLTVGLDGAICIWDGQTASCIRSIALRVAMRCCRFHCLNPNLALVGNDSGHLEIYNCSAGTLHQSYKVAGKFQWDLQVTAVEQSNHHVFVGDSQGFIHLYRSEMHDGQLKQLVWQMKLHVSSQIHKAPQTIIQVEFVAFCRATDTPVLLTTSRDGTISLLRIHEKHHRMDRHSWCAAAVMARDIRAVVCPLSAIQEVPRIAMGAEDTNVYIFNIAGGSHKPVVLNTLKGHRAPVVGVSFAFDESLLASGDSDGTLIVWRRSALM